MRRQAVDRLASAFGGARHHACLAIADELQRSAGIATVTTGLAAYIASSVEARSSSNG
jgi:hypothetical protein